MKSPLRSDPKYIEIEKFKKYEMMQCIAYEMAIRNSEVRELVNKRNSIGVFENLSSQQVDKLLLADSYEKAKIFMLSYFKEDIARVQRLDEETKLDDAIKDLSYFAIPLPPNKMTSRLLENPFFKKSLEKDSQRNQALKSSIIKKEGLGIKKMFEDDGTVSTVKGGTIKYDELFPKFSRPIPAIPTCTSKEIDLMLNLALPTEELTALVETIKKAYDKSSGEVFQVLTPLISAANIDREIFTIRIKVKKKGSKTKLGMPEKSQQEVYADLLFLHDVFNSQYFKKQGDKIRHFQGEMIDYYAKKVCKYHKIKDIDDVSGNIGTPRDQTVRDYVKMMKSYIDDFGYKKLLV